MTRYIIETKQLSGQWLAPSYPRPGKSDHIANSKAGAIAKANSFAAELGCPKRVVDRKSGQVVHTVGDTPEFEARGKAMRESFEATVCTRS